MPFVVRYDVRLTFRNLKEGKLDNPIPASTIDSLWIPRLSLLNGLDEFQTVVTEEDAEFFRGYIWRRNRGFPNSLEHSAEGTFECALPGDEDRPVTSTCFALRISFLTDELFKGSLNPIILKREFYQEFT